MSRLLTVMDMVNWLLSSGPCTQPLKTGVKLLKAPPLRLMVMPE